ncbi:FAD-dependent monooxygenase [Actinomadura terrae]|uniref:FAD-dependent monooxygenase n=1 Tax=Actinomadura terrae TaxID=604353 RepID=UPI001FA74548|nr:FAD-dependent monooxygenase [Actinomadura terrae]
MNILISGASVAGPALAYWLHRHGFTPTIVERAETLRDGGHAVDFRGEAHLSVLNKMGILKEIERAATGMGPVSYVNTHGKVQARIPTDLFSGDIEILRGDLARILYDATRHDTEYLFGDSITSITEDPGGVDVTFEHAAPRRFDLVVGADGLHSGVRRLAFGPEEQFVRHLGLYLAICTTPNHLGLDHAGLGYRTADKLVMVYSARHNTEARALFYFGSPQLDVDRHDTAAQRAILTERFAGSGWETDRILDWAREAPDFYFDAVAQVRMDAWTRGRVALLGDAAWCPSPLTGMGTGLAIVGAYVLAGELAAAHDDHPSAHTDHSSAHTDHRAAFAGYEAILREYVARCQKIGDGVAKMMVPSSRVAAALLNRYYALIPYLPGKKLMAKMARRTAESVNLHNYPRSISDSEVFPA